MSDDSISGREPQGLFFLSVHDHKNECYALHPKGQVVSSLLPDILKIGGGGVPLRHRVPKRCVVTCVCCDAP